MFAMETGSAYQDESWCNFPPGESRLQRQVLSVFERLNEPPERVLAGNLVPFRSQKWHSLKNRQASVEFGKLLWLSVLRRAQPSVIVTMGAKTTQVIANTLNIDHLQRHPVGWGNIGAYHATYDGGQLIGLPHLSRYSIMTRPQSAPYLANLFSL